VKDAVEVGVAVDLNLALCYLKLDRSLTEVKVWVETRAFTHFRKVSLGTLFGDLILFEEAGSESLNTSEIALVQLLKSKQCIDST